MTIQQLKYVIAVAETGSFSAAARELYMSQPALSKQVSLLEKELGFLIFKRDGYRPTLTTAGKRYYEGIKNLFDEYDRLLDDITTSEKLKLSIAFTGAYEQRFAIQVMKSLRKEKLFDDMNFLKGSFEDAVKYIQSGEADLCFGTETSFQNVKGVSYQVLFPFEMCVICSFDHPFTDYECLTPEDLKGEDVIVFSEKFGSGFYRAFMDACRQDGVKFHIKKKVDSYDELISEVAIGNGIAIVSKDIVRTTEVKAVPLENSHHKENSVLAYRSENEAKWTPILERIVEAFQDYNEKL